MNDYLVFFASEHPEFRQPEILALADLFKARLEIQGAPPEQSLVWIKMETDEDVRRVAERSVTTKAFLDIWAVESSANWEGLVEKAKEFAKSHADLVSSLTNENVSFKFRVETFGKRGLSQEWKIQTMKRFDFLNFKGKVDMNTPEVTWWIIADYGENHPLKMPPEQPLRLFFGREIGQTARPLIETYTLKKRAYLGTTSFDAELSLICSNMARIKPGSFIFDPFAGTGSFLVAASAFGATSLGGDIDIRVLNGREDKTNVVSNMIQYGLEHLYCGVIRFDFAKSDVIHGGPIFDAIVTDPPYGVRAGAKKVAMKKDIVPLIELPEGQGFLPHYSQTVPYSVPEVLTDLINYAARTIVKGGYLVYWLPTTTDYKDSDLPQHPCFQLIGNSNQPMQMRWSRRMITLKKVVDYDVEKHGSIKMTYDPFQADETAPAHDDFAAKVMLDPTRSQKAKTNRNELKAEIEGHELGWITRKKEKRAKRQRLDEKGNSKSSNQSDDF